MPSTAYPLKSVQKLYQMELLKIDQNRLKGKRVTLSINERVIRLRVFSKSPSFLRNTTIIELDYSKICSSEFRGKDKNKKMLQEMVRRLIVLI